MRVVRGPYRTNPRPGSVPLFSGGLVSLAGLAALFSMAFGDAEGTPSPSPTPTIPPQSPDWATRPSTRAARLQADAERAPGTEQRWSDTDMLAAVDARVRLPELLDRLRDRGFQPRIAFTWRALATQDDLLAQKRSLAAAPALSRSQCSRPPACPFSFHNAVHNGQPAALAADLFDARYGWGDDAHGSPKSNGALAFFRAVGEEARALGLVWGGSWTGRPSFWSRYDLGWNPAHRREDCRAASFVLAVLAPGGLPPNREFARIRSLTLPQVLGKGRVVAGSGGYVYRQFGNGYVQVVDGPALKGQLLMPRGNAKAWRAITSEIGAVPGQSGLLA